MNKMMKLGKSQVICKLRILSHQWCYIRFRCTCSIKEENFLQIKSSTQCGKIELLVKSTKKCEILKVCRALNTWPNHILVQNYASNWSKMIDGEKKNN